MVIVSRRMEPCSDQDRECRWYTTTQLESEEFGWKFKSKFNIKSLDLGEFIQHESRYVYVINMTLDLIKLVLHDR